MQIFFYPLSAADSESVLEAISTPTRRCAVKVMVFAKATQNTEDGTPPDPEAIQAMHDFNEALIAAGILKDQILGGLLPTQFAKRVHFSGKNRTVIDGPFTETKELVTGFALWEVKSIEEAVEWAKKSPVTTECELDIRPLFTEEDVAAWANLK
jgi:Uncharacterized protein conserved in bacteria